MYALIILFTAAVLALFSGIFFKERKVTIAISMLGLIGALVSIGIEWLSPTALSFDSKMMVFDHYALSFGGVILLTATLIGGLSGFSFRNIKDALGDHYGLILFSLCGALCMVSFTNLVMLFLGIEILSIPMYVLAGSRRDDISSNEAGMKYYLMGAFATGILLFGIALIYGATHTFDMTGILTASAVQAGKMPVIFYAGVIMMMAGMCFKVSAFPFHFWAPDVYEGSPSLVTAFMATVVKTAAFGAFFRLFLAFVIDDSAWTWALAIVAALTMTVANITAIYQQSVKRMLAYSSISHAGYLLLGIIALQQHDGFGCAEALLLYTLAYSVATVCIFAVYILVNEQTGRSDFGAFNGLATRKPLLALVMTIGMMSLAGIPPLAGFFGKYMLFTKIISSQPWLVVIAVVNSVMSIFYYFRILQAMYFTPPAENSAEIKVPVSFTVIIVLGALTILGICVVPDLAHYLLK